MAHDKGSFDYKVLNEKIAKILDTRSQLNNTVQVAMPFVKATTTIQHEILGAGCIGFTLGLHAINEDVKYEDIYSNQSGDMPLIGYTYDQSGYNQRVYAQNPNSEIAQTVSKIFDRRASLFSNTKSPDGRDFIRIPPPGITQVTVGRNKNGLLATAQLQISVPSLVQLESLHRTFLVPGLGMILEWGQQFAAESTVTDDTIELPDISTKMFPWHDREKTLKIINQLAKNEYGLMDILNDYVYPSNGQYMWMFGRVANFNVKSNSDGSFDCTVKIVGPSEDSWAYSTLNTVVPAKDPSIKLHCAANTNSVVSYFSDTTPNTLNLKSLLDATLKGGPWQNHVISFTQGNTKGGEPQPDDKKPTTSNVSFADTEDAYFMSWRFFVNVVLNDETVGVKGIFKKASLTKDELDKISILLPYLTTSDRKTSFSTPGTAYIDDPMESFVGMNKHLRSIDPSTMIIVNELAAQLAAKNPQYNIPGSPQELLRTTNDSNKFSSVGWFDKSAIKEVSDQTNPDRGFLSTGVWLNHKTVVESMIGGDTILRGIVNLLERMNQATLNYWQLTLDVTESDSTTSVHPSNYMVVDANFRNSSDKAVSKFINNVYTFNKYVRTDNKTGELIGSELIDCSIDLSLPKRLFSQIATMGLVQPEDLQKVSDGGKTKEDLETEAAAAKAAGNDYTNIKSPKLSDPNDTLREMFSITTLSVKGDNEQGPDLTILPKSERKALLAINGQCGQGNTQTTAQTGGNSNKPANVIVEEAAKNKSDEQLKQLKDSANRLVSGSQCMECAKCIESEPPRTDVTKFPPEANLNQSAAAFLSKEEGLPKGGKAYYDPPNQTTLISIGYGHQIKDSEYQQGYIQAGDEKIPIRGVRGIDTVMTKAQSQKLLAIDVTRYVTAARAPLGEAAWNKLTTNQKVALTSYAYNTGSTRSLVRAGILNTIDQNDSSGAAAIIRDKGIRTAGGKVLPVLVERRSREASLFASDSIGKTTTPTTPVVSTNICEDVYKKVGGKAICDECKKQTDILRQVEVKTTETKKAAETIKENVVRQFFGLQNVFRYVEIFPDYMVAEITDSADGNLANAFGASPGALSINGDLTLPGINGIRVGELLWIDRIPVFYKAFGAFQVMSIEDVIDTSGWRTKLNVRFNFLGRKWTQSMAQKLTGAN